ncbi:zinc finger protein 431-like [Vanessa cardui]|uniref:zinc finger protein 431-like n=1 Tax=Vanessa cardui TaxID=171605 RepID=UPI001F1442E5|nr:zinc finger protein 431-like [Vanessa cardui]XP_046975823.1 zinc finger protein 431-like [Vanessa cardui]
MTEILNLNALCRCCHAGGSFKELNSPCEIKGSLELCTDLLQDTFGIILQSSSIDVSNTICEDCISQLQNATTFKRQVVECEQKFQEYCKNELLQYTSIKLEKENDFDVVAKTEIDLKDEDSDHDYEPIEETCTIDVKSEHQDSSKVVVVEVENNPPVQHEKQKRKPKVKSKKVNLGRALTQDNADKYICKICDINCKNVKSLRKHVSDIHNTIYKCSICDIKFKKREAYDNHVYKHSICVNPTIPLSNMTKFDCQMCSKSYRTINDLRLHRNAHTRESTYTCDICKSEYLRKVTLKKHILCHMGLNKKHMCHTCGHSFNDITNLNKHITTVHDKLKLYKCTLCPKEFSSNKTLKVHTRLHTGERPYVCNTCDKAFISHSNLSKHKTKHENKEKFGGIYICKFCKSAFDHRGLYTSHLRSHIAVRKYNCTLCDANFVDGYSLKRHVESHSNVKSHSCDKCDRKYTTKGKLNLHKRKHHTRLKTNKKVKIEKVACEVCKKLFTNIDEHMKAHYNKRHSCEFCDKSYAERNTLTRHVKQCHDGFRHECDVCAKRFVNSTGLKKHKIKLHGEVVKKKEEE